MPIVKYSWVGLREWIEALENIGHADVQLISDLEEVLHTQFLDTQARVASPEFHHVTTYIPTGALQASGQTSSDFDGENWSGEITYGNAQVDYALYEMNRGGIHDWFSELPVLEHLYEEALARFLERNG